MTATNVNRGQLMAEIEDYAKRYVHAFNAGDADSVNALYGEDAVSVWDRAPVSGTELRERVKEFLATGPSMKTKLLDVLFAGNDIAMMFLEWEMEVSNPEGQRETYTGVAHDVLRRDATGAWRHLVDNPWGADPAPNSSPPLFS